MRLNLPDSLGKTSDIISLHRLEFYEQRDACFGEEDDPVIPLLDPLGVYHYEISRILLFRIHKSRPEYLVEWTGFDASYNEWVHRDVLVQDVPSVLLVYDSSPSPMVARPYSSIGTQVCYKGESVTGCWGPGFWPGVCCWYGPNACCGLAGFVCSCLARFSVGFVGPVIFVYISFLLIVSVVKYNDSVAR